MAACPTQLIRVSAILRSCVRQLALELLVLPLEFLDDFLSLFLPVCVCSQGSCWLMTDPSPYNLKKDYVGSLVTRTWLSLPWCDYGRHTLP